MKKVYLLSALGGLLLVSCANDDLVVKPVAPSTDSQAAIAFQMKLGNMSRGTDIALNDVMDNFGVWAIKGNAATDLEKFDSNTEIGNLDDALKSLVVIPNYRVNYEAAEAYGSHWNYVTADWANPVKDPTANPAANLEQYLKYWDGSYGYTYFFAYGPHWTDMTKTDATKSKQLPSLVVNNTKAEATMTFPAFVTSADPNKNFIYADARREKNSDHVTAATGGTTANPTKVPLNFHRIFSQVKIQIWEDIPGYDVEMESLTFVAGASGTTEAAAGTYGIAAIPADYTAPSTWARGQYLNQGTPVVVYSEDATKTPADYAKTTLSYNNGDMGKTNLNFTLPTGKIGETRTSASPSETVYNVMPNYYDPTQAPAQPANLTMADDGTNTNTPKTWSANSGLQFVMNYVLKAKDTKEEIHVKGARVYVTPDYTNWAPNTVYTYIFKITKNSSGTTTTADVANDPEQPKDALYPIIFDQLYIVNGETNESEWLVNGVEFQETTKTLTVGDEYTIDYIYDGLKLDWSSSDENVATVANGVVTAKNAGRATITATTPNKATATCQITVVPTEGFKLLQTTAAVETDATVQIDFVSDGDKTPAWTSSDETVATVDANGVVTGVKAGTATITVTYGSATIDPNTVTVTVRDPATANP